MRRLWGSFRAYGLPPFLFVPARANAFDPRRPPLMMRQVAGQVVQSARQRHDFARNAIQGWYGTPSADAAAVSHGKGRFGLSAKTS
jgi:hypothetical protein